MVVINSRTSCSQIPKSCFCGYQYYRLSLFLLVFIFNCTRYIEYLNISERFPVFSFNCRYLCIFCFLTIEASIKDLKTTESYMDWLLESGFQNLLSQWETDVHVMYRTRDNDGVIFHVSSTVTAEFIRLEVMYRWKITDWYILQWLSFELITGAIVAVIVW